MREVSFAGLAIARVVRRMYMSEYCHAAAASYKPVS